MLQNEQAVLFAIYNGIALVVLLMAAFMTYLSIATYHRKMPSFEYCTSQAMILWGFAIRGGWNSLFAYNRATENGFMWMVNTPAVTLVTSFLIFSGLIWHFSVLTRRFRHDVWKWIGSLAIIVMVLSYVWIGVVL